MLSDLTIQNYRCFQDFRIDGLARVNLIVGSNNIGKTSFLEAIYLLVNLGAPHCLADLLYNRGEIADFTDRNPVIESQSHEISYLIKHLFYGHNPDLSQIINLQSISKEQLLVKIYLEKQEDGLKPYKLVLSTNINNSKVFLPMEANGSVLAKYMQTIMPSKQEIFKEDIGLINNKCNFLLTTNSLSFNKLASLWNKITLTPKEDKIIDALRIIQPDLERINFTSPLTFNSGVIVRQRGQYPLPIGSMGEGMRRLLTLAMTAVAAENGYLLVDEIETGLYYENQSTMWKLIFEIAQNLNIQVFATTHSWDCISAFYEALTELKEPSEGKLLRLDDKYGKLRAVEYSSEVLSSAVLSGIEVR